MLSTNEIKLIKSLKHKKFRIKHSLFVAEGDKLIRTLLSSDNYKVQSIYYSKNKGLHQHNRYEIKSHILDERTMKTISHMTTATDCLALVEIMQTSPKPYRKALYLDGVQDPGNVGTIIRIADWFGLDSVIRSLDSADFYNSKVVQSSMGAFANVQLLEMSVSQLLSVEHIPIFAADMTGIPLQETKKPEQFILVMGGEGNGISKEVANSSIQKISIKGSDSKISESLNVAIAAGVLCEKFS